MTDPADLLLANGEVHTLAPPTDGAGDGESDGTRGDGEGESADDAGGNAGGDSIHEAVAVRDGRIVDVGDSYELDFLEGVDTRRVDLEGRVVLPGFVDAHTHMEQFGRYLIHADLSTADSAAAALSALRAEADDPAAVSGDWVLGYGYDESDWPDGEYLTREQLDEVSTDRPVAAVRVDMHTASLNSVALSRLAGRMPDGDVRTAGGDPTGVVVEDAVGTLREAIAPDEAGTRRLVEAARDVAHRRGVTGVHEMIRESLAPRVYRRLEREGELGLRVRINYWRDHLAAAVETGLVGGHGGDLVRTGGIKTFTDGSIGARTARLSRPYADGDAADGDSDGARDDGASDDATGAGDDEDGVGQWVVDPEDLRDLVARADEEGFQVCAHAIGDRAVEAALSAYEAVEGDGPAASGGDGGDGRDDRGDDGDGGDDGSDPSGAGSPRHRIEHAELVDDDQLARMADAGVVASMQPNFLQWAREGGLYDRRLGPERRRASNPYRAVLDAGVDLAFGSDCMPLDPLLGVQHAVTAPVERQRLGVTEALRAYTLGGARAGHDEGRLGTVEPGKCADLVVLERSPWDHPESIAEVDVAGTVVAGEVVYDDLPD